MKYKTKDGLTVSQSNSHNGMWIIESENGKFHSLYATEKIIKEIHKPIENERNIETTN